MFNPASTKTGLDPLKQIKASVKIPIEDIEKRNHKFWVFV